MRTTIFSDKGYGFQVMPIINSWTIKMERDRARKIEQEYPEIGGHVEDRYPDCFISKREQETSNQD